MSSRVRAIWRVVAAAPILALLVAFASAPPALACRCAPVEPMAAIGGDPSRAVVVGGIVSADDRGVSVLVESWLSGAGAGPMVTLRPDGFTGGEAGCGAERPPIGSRWILVLFDWRPGGSGLVNACTPHGDLATPAGQAMLAEAVAAFGPGSAAPGPSAAPGVPEPGASDGIDPLPFGAAGAILALAALGVVRVALRRARGGA
jgi:hypothetical protein